MQEAVTAADRRSRQRETPAWAARPNTGWRLPLLAVVVLSYLVWATFWPMLGFQFVDFDVNDQVIKNVHIHGLSWENVKHILTSRCVSSYYPVRTLTLAVDYQIWGLRPLGFKLTNGLLHWANVLLVFWLVLRLLRLGGGAVGWPGRWQAVGLAAFSAGLMAIHPVVVEPVVWVGGREELLMTLGALGCFHCHLSARRSGAAGRVVWWHVVSAACAAVACFSNAAGAVVPLLVTAWDVATMRPLRIGRVAAGTAALWALGATAVVLKKINYTGDTIAPLPSPLTAEWMMLIFQTYWLNLATLFWPSRLCVLYDWLRPRGFADPTVLAGMVAVGVTACLLRLVWRWRTLFFALVWFVLALAPYSQIMLHHIQRADRFLYLPLVGLTVAAGLALAPLARRVRNAGVAAALVAAVAVAWLGLQWRTAQQIQTWRDSTTMWAHCVRVAPGNPMAHCCLADSLARDGRYTEAFRHYQRALELDPYDVASLFNSAVQLATCPDPSLRNWELAIELAELSDRLSEGKDRHIRRTLAKMYSDYAKQLRDKGRYAEAIACCRRAADVDPGFDTAQFNLAVLLATCPDPALRCPQEAVRVAERAARLVEPLDADRLQILAICYQAAGQAGRAEAALRRAAEAAEAAGRKAVAKKLRAELDHLRQQTHTGEAQAEAMDNQQVP